MEQLQVVKLSPHAITPTQAHPGEDLGYDLYASEDVELQPLKPTLVPTGLALHYVSDTSQYGLKIFDRSSMALKNHVMTMAGVIDAGYTGEIGVVMVLVGETSYKIHRGDKIAQVVPIEVHQGEIKVVAEIENTGRRGASGFGSSGR